MSKPLPDVPARYWGINLTTDAINPLKKVAEGLQEIGRDLLPHTKNGDINHARNELFTEWAVLDAVIDCLEELEITLSRRK